MRTVFTSEDIRNLIDHIFNGNLWASKYSKGQIAYENENSEEILMIDDIDGTRTNGDLATYLNIKFYNWKERLVEKGSETNENYSIFDDWVQSLNLSMNESYALVEKTDEEVVASQDIDSATLSGKVTFLIQTNKIKNLDYYITKIRNKFLGNPQEIQNSYGEKIKAFIMIGGLTYDEEPFTIQIGECIKCSFNYSISYLNNAGVYSDYKFELSLDGDDTYNNGEIVGETKYKTIPLTKITWQNLFGTSAVTKIKRPDLTGNIATSLSTIKTFTFFDFDKELSLALDELFWGLPALKINGVETQTKNINIPVFIRVTTNGKFYIYKDVIDQMEKVITNNDFTICSITLKGMGK